MPKVRVVYYQETPGKAPVLDWIEETEKNHCDSSNKFIACIERLQIEGYKLHRPSAEYLRDDIYELRATYQNRAYRILYFFHKQTAVLCNALLKREDNRREFDKAIDKAIERNKKYIENPTKYTYEE